jgi:hypothetical protein
MPNYIGKRRLLKLADMLEEDAKNKKGLKFNIAVVGVPMKGMQQLEDDEVPKDYQPKLDCGTSGCAMGLAAISGRFKRAGLSYELVDAMIETTMNGRVVDYDIAAQELFNITGMESHYLFSPFEYPFGTVGAKGERYVAKRIRQFVVGKVQP